MTKGKIQSFDELNESCVSGFCRHLFQIVPLCHDQLHCTVNNDGTWMGWFGSIKMHFPPRSPLGGEVDEKQRNKLWHPFRGGKPISSLCIQGQVAGVPLCEIVQERKMWKSLFRHRLTTSGKRMAPTTKTRLRQLPMAARWMDDGTMTKTIPSNPNTDWSHNIFSTCLSTRQVQSCSNWFSKRWKR